MKKFFKNLLASFILLILLVAVNANAATHTVTNSNNTGAGSLRQMIANAKPNDTIRFAANVTSINLTGNIRIDKNLTIIGNASKTTIRGKHNSSSNGGAFDVWGNNVTFTVINCIFNECSVRRTSSDGKVSMGGSGGAVYVLWSNFIAINCSFNKNNTGGVASEASDGANAGSGGAVYVLWGNFIAINCTFSENNTNSIGGNWVQNGSGGAVYVLWSNFTAINCTFSKNSNNAIYGIYGNNIYLYHCTFDDNEGGGISNFITLHSYNCIYTENEMKGTVLAGNNLIANGSTITRPTIFGTNTLTTNGHITPLPFATSAMRLTADNIKTPEGIPADSIIFWLSKDQAGKLRPYLTNKFVTFGSIEVERKTEPKTYKVTLNTDIPGVTLTGKGVYAENTNVAINAIFTDECHLLKEWTDGNNNVVSTSNPLQITLIRDTILNVADFKLKQYHLTVYTNTGGTTTPSGSEGHGTIHNCGEVVAVTAIPDACYKFVKWIVDPHYDFESYSNPIEITIPFEYGYLMPIFEYDTCFTFTLNTTEGGTTNPSGTSTKNRDEIVTITATPDSCYSFKNWTSKGKIISSENPLEITVIRDTNLTANFEIIQYEIILDATEGGTVSGEGSFNCGSNRTITATVNDGYLFESWTDKNGTVLSDENPFTFLLTQDTLIVANFVDTVGIVENNLISSIRIIPNPVNSKAIIEINSLEAQANTVITILDLSGREILTVYSGLLNEGVNNFPLPNDLANGGYFVLVKNRNGQKIEQFIIAR